MQAPANKYDKIIYDRFIASHPIQGYFTSMNTSEREGVYNVLDYFYKGAEPAGGFMQAADEVNKVKMLRRTTKGNLWRSVQAAYDMLNFIKSSSQLSGPGNKSEEDYKASVQNLYTGDQFEVHLQESQEIQGKTDLLVYSSNGEGSFGVPSQDEIDFRNWLMRQAQNSKNIRNILDCFGLFLAHANALVRESYVPSVANVADIKRGSDLEKVLPDEFLGLAAEEMELLFYYGLATKNLLQYDCRKKDNTAKGDLVFLLDISGSMSEPVKRGEKFSKLDISLGFLLAMIKILEKQGRNCKVFAYSEMCMEVLDTSKTKVETVFRTLLNIHASGGTRTEAAFKHVLDKTEDDVVIVTDGIDGNFTGRSLNKGKKRVSCLLISESDYGTTPLKKFVDSFILANGIDGFKHLTKEFI
jgi:hypothetical protein